MISLPPGLGGGGGDYWGVLTIVVTILWRHVLIELWLRTLHHQMCILCIHLLRNPHLWFF